MIQGRSTVNMIIIVQTVLYLLVCFSTVQVTTSYVNLHIDKEYSEEISLTDDSQNDGDLPDVSEYFITILVNNTLGREIRILPSKGSRHGYVVNPHSYIKVHMIFKDLTYQEPIIFTAKDLETETSLLINDNKSPVSVTPTDSPDTITKFIITAEAPYVKPVVSWVFTAITGSVIPGSPELSVHGNVTMVDHGLHLDGSTTYMDTYIPDSNYLHDPDSFSFGTKLRLYKSSNDDKEPHYILDMEGDGDNTKGVALFVENDKLVAEVTTKSMKYEAATPTVHDEWMYVTVTFKKDLGLFLYINAQLRSIDDTGNPVLVMQDTRPLNTSTKLVIGRNTYGPPYNYATFDIASLTVFPEHLDQADVNRAYIFFWQEDSAKLYYARLRIINDSGKSAILKPNKGNPNGFYIKPNSTTEIVLLSMSTGNKPTEPVTFRAMEKQTSRKLMINNSVRPFSVMPKETKKDITTIVITSDPADKH